MARPKPELILSDDERDKLNTWASRPKSSQRLALRARLVLACADEPSNKAVAARLNRGVAHLVGFGYLPGYGDLG